MAIQNLLIFFDDRESAIPGRWIVDNVPDSIDTLVLSGVADIAISQTTLKLDTRNSTENLLTYLQPTTSFRLIIISQREQSQI